MKKLSILILCVFMLLSIVTLAAAYMTGGQFAGDNVSNPLRYSTEFAPNAATTVNLGTKGGYTNFSLKNITAYKFFFQKVSDKTSVTGKVKFGGYSSGYGTAGAFSTSEDKFTVGNGLKFVGFGNYSGPAAQVTILSQ